jgi:hypothetical protein
MRGITNQADWGWPGGVPGVTIVHMAGSVGAFRVAAAFVRERESTHAMRMISSVIDEPVGFSRREVLGEDGSVHLVILEASCDRPSTAGRVRTLMLGFHGIEVPVAGPQNAVAVAS